MPPSDAAVLSSLRSQIDDLVARVLAVAQPYAGTPDSAITADLYAAERSLLAAGKSLSRATASITSAGTSPGR